MWKVYHVHTPYANSIQSNLEHPICCLFCATIWINFKFLGPLIYIDVNRYQYHWISQAGFNQLFPWYKKLSHFWVQDQCRMTLISTFVMQNMNLRMPSFQQTIVFILTSRAQTRSLRCWVDFNSICGLWSRVYDTLRCLGCGSLTPTQTWNLQGLLPLV